MSEDLVLGEGIISGGLDAFEVLISSLKQFYIFKVTVEELFNSIANR